MTGRELIVYILQNNLEDEIVVENDIFFGMMTEKEASIKFGVGEATIRAWYELGALHGIKIGNSIFILDKNKIIGSDNS